MAAPACRASCRRPRAGSRTRTPRGKAPCLPFDGQNAAFAFRTHADRARVRLQIALPEPHAFGEPAPCLAFDKKFSLDFHVHVILPYGPMPYASPLPHFGPGVQAGRFPPERLPYAGRFPGSGYMGNTPPPFPFGNAFYSRLRNKAKRCTDTDSVIVDAPLFPACPSGLVRPISMRILS